MSELIVGADGRARCPWPGPADSEYQRYHDEEWGVPLHGEQPLFERLCLEAFQSGLSWLIILRKREGFRAAFARFDPKVVAGFDQARMDELLTNPAIVRNRAKIAAAVRNANAVRALDVPLDELLWSFAPDRKTVRHGWDDVPAVTPESTAMARELKRRGFSFVGPTTCYALMQATGMVDDHLAGCWRAGLS
ncbi:MAG TPA: DNA-3-methyladenine glycosylase I [Pseudonocardiaceae bacterium]|nr:DNA-3-methyladenine glycosylase I [Pseudonocardiaceae bacterium]